MLNKQIIGALNDQLNVELGAAYSYLALAAYFDKASLKGFARWMKVQGQEEMDHANRLYEFINEREGSVELQSISAPSQTWSSPRNAIEYALTEEKEVSRKIDGLVELAAGARDHATEAFLQWFIREQVEEEATINDVVQQLELIGEDNNGLFLLDRDMGQRGAKTVEA